MKGTADLKNRELTCHHLFPQGADFTGDDVTQANVLLPRGEDFQSRVAAE